uniref:RNA-directed DNA polymerase n=1 Tax=Cyanistes caeruleus TaxID=156563 RepID=A0A8C0VR97_CYACU
MWLEPCLEFASRFLMFISIIIWMTSWWLCPPRVNCIGYSLSCSPPCILMGCKWLQKRFSNSLLGSIWGSKFWNKQSQHQKVEFVHSVKTLNDAQKLVGVITWLHPYLGLTMTQLSPLFALLEGVSDLKSPRILMPEARQVLEEAQRTVSACQFYRIDPSIDVAVFIVTPDLHSAGIIGQWNDEWSDPLHVLEWIFLPHQLQKTVTALFDLIARLIIKCWQQCLQLMGADPAKIVLPVPREDFDWSFVNSISMQSALENFSGRITYHLPSYKLLQVGNFTELSLRPKHSQEPVQGPTAFTDGSGRTGKAIATWKDGSEWQVLESREAGSAQLVELRAAVMAFQKFSQEPSNLVTDSAYVAGIAQRLGHSVLKEVSNPALFHSLKAPWNAIQAQVHLHYVLHVRSHTNLPGFIAEGNARADKLANPAWVVPQPDTLGQAKASHGFFHQNTHTLQKQFQLTSAEAHDIVESCDDCHVLAAPLPAGVNPRGLRALELWQMDVTQVAKFGQLWYVHVNVDTFSSAMWASAHTGEKTCDVLAHWRQAFAALGVPSAVKTDNGPAYTSQKVRQFLQLWGMSYKFGIPHSLSVRLL